MPISYEPQGYGQLVMDLAQAAAGAKASRIAAELQARAEEVAANRQFQRDIRIMDYQFELQKEAKAREWDLEKMEIASRLDFERSEKKRNLELDEIDLKMKKLDEAYDNGNGVLTSEEYTKAKKGLQLKLLGLEEAAASLYPREIESSGLAQVIKGLEEKRRLGGVGTAPTTPVSKTVIIGKEGKIQLVGPGGDITDVSPMTQLTVLKRSENNRPGIISVGEALASDDYIVTGVYGGPPPTTQTAPTPSAGRYGGFQMFPEPTKPETTEERSVRLAQESKKNIEQVARTVERGRMAAIWETPYQYYLKKAGITPEYIETMRALEAEAKKRGL